MNNKGLPLPPVLGAFLESVVSGTQGATLTITSLVLISYSSSGGEVLWLAFNCHLARVSSQGLHILSGIPAFSQGV